jgi:hypothetical protein
MFNSHLRDRRRRKVRPGPGLVELAIAIGFCLGGLMRNDCLAVDAGLGPGERLALVDIIVAWAHTRFTADAGWRA